MSRFTSHKPLSFERRMAKGAPWLLVLVAILTLIVLWGIYTSVSTYRRIEIYRKNEVQNTLDSFSRFLTSWMKPKLIRRLWQGAVLQGEVYCYRITDKTGAEIMPDYSYSPVPVPQSKYLAFVPEAPTEAAVLFDLVVGAASIYGGSWLEGAGAASM